MQAVLRRLPLGTTRYGRRGYLGYRFANLGALGQDGSLDFQDFGPAIDFSSISPAPGSIDTSAEGDFGTLGPAPSTIPLTYTDPGTGIPYVNVNGVWQEDPFTLTPTTAAGLESQGFSPAAAQSTAAMLNKGAALTSMIASPVPVTSPVGVTAGGGTSVASALNWFSQASMIAGVPNGVLILGGALAIAAIGAFARR